MDASQSLGRRQNAAHLDSTTIVEASCSLSLRGTSGERAGERGTFHRIGAANWDPLSRTLSPLLCRGEREAWWWWCQDATSQNTVPFSGVNPLPPASSLRNQGIGPTAA